MNGVRGGERKREEGNRVQGCRLGHAYTSPLQTELISCSVVQHANTMGEGVQRSPRAIGHER